MARLRRRHAPDAERAGELRAIVRKLRRRARHTGPNPLDRLSDAEVVTVLRQVWGPALGLGGRAR
jgi:hypothetical protein